MFRNALVWLLEIFKRDLTCELWYPRRNLSVIPELSRVSKKNRPVIEFMLIIDVRSRVRLIRASGLLQTLDDQ